MGLSNTIQKCASKRAGRNPLHRWARLYRLALNLGLREAELLGLTWDAVNFEQGTLHVYQQLPHVPKASEDGKEFVLQTTKTASSDRVLDLDVDLLADLRTLRKNQLEERLLLGKRWKDTWGLVFVSENGAPIHASNLLAHFRKALKAAGLPIIRFHDLRLSCATFLLAQGVSPRVVMELLGHNQISTTMNIYAHVLPETLRQATDKMESLFEEDQQEDYAE